MKQLSSLKQIPHKSLLALFLIIVCAILTRTVFLNEAPIGLNHDEITFVANAKAVALTGKDLSGTWSPLSLTPISYGFPMSELPPVIVSPLLGILPSSPFAARLPYALFSVLLVAEMYFIARKLFGEKTAIAVGLVAAFNPWGIMFGRTAFDSPLAVCFYMLAFLLLLYLKNWKILLAFIPLFIAFYCYIATKIILIPFVFITSYFGWIVNQKKYLKYYVLVCLAGIILTAGFIFSLRTNTTAVRLSEISTPFSNNLTQEVNKERNLSVTNPLTPVFSNKVALYIRDFSQKYAEAFSPDYLFFSGDSDMHLSLWFQGYFYYLDAVFLLIGFCMLFAKNKKYWLAITALALIAPLPAALHTGAATYVTRGVLIFPILILLIGFGIASFIDLFKSKFRLIVTLLLFAFYAVLFLNFVNVYLFRFPLYNSEGVDFSSRVLSRYVALVAQTGRNVTVYNNEPDALYKDYLFYANAYDKQNASEVAKHFEQYDFSLNNVYFKKGCPSNQSVSSSSAIIVAVSSDCNSGKISNTDYVGISQLGDGALVHKIYFDTLCKPYSLSSILPRSVRLSDFNIEKIPTQRFCEMFIATGR
jgi:4-amino-4-deoxy-L-arabinose transferase-like glycosyltransferase